MRPRKLRLSRVGLSPVNEREELCRVKGRRVSFEVMFICCKENDITKWRNYKEGKGSWRRKEGHW